VTDLAAPSTSPASHSILGNRVVRKEDPRMLTQGGTYVDDVRDPLLANAAHVFYLRSTMAHAKILSIDVSAARAMPGVVDVIVGTDLDLKPFPIDLPGLPKTTPRAWLASDTVRYVGEPIAAIVTEQRSQGPDAAEMIVVDYEHLDVVVQPEEALTTNVRVHSTHDSNIALTIAASDPISFAECDVVVEQRIVNSRIAPGPIETRNAAAAWSSDGRLNHWTSCQGPHPFRDFIARAYGIEAANIRVITPDVGGGFGAKATPYPEDVLLGWIAKRVGRAVKWTSFRSDDMTNLGHGRGQIQTAKMGGKRDGTILAYELAVLQDSGAYPRYGAYLPNLTKMMQPGVYDIAAIAFSAQSVLTNTTPLVPFRGAGRPEATAAIERIVDVFAAEIGMDPAEVRRKNLIGADRFPFTSKGGAVYDCGTYEASLDLALEAANYKALRVEQVKRRANGDKKLLGIGVAMYVEVTGGGGGSEYGSVEILANGKVRALTGSLPYGTGHDTSWAMLISEQLGISINDIDVIHGDTDVVPRGGLTGGSRSLQIAGSAMYGAAGGVKDQARAIAAQLLEADIDDVVLDTSLRTLTGSNRAAYAQGDAAFHVVGVPSIRKTWADIATAAAQNGDVLRSEIDFTQAGATFPSGTHIAVVEVDSETGQVTVVQMIACDDAGRILNPLLVEGQVHGGLASGIAQALLEEFVYDTNGNPLTSNLADYGLISATELPMFTRVPIETPTPLNPLGAKGIGESGTVGSTPALQNAVVDAVAHLGVRHIDMPATAEKVWRAITSR
jgi:aerobic carbon-monoxide dehydrogenase large subunit